MASENKKRAENREFKHRLESKAWKQDVFGSLNRVSIAEIKARSKGHFFDKDTIHFFLSRLPDDGYRKGRDIYFITSEQFDPGQGQALAPRKYTIRKLLPNGSIEGDERGDMLLEFQKFGSSAEAKNALKKRLEE